MDASNYALLGAFGAAIVLVVLMPRIPRMEEQLVAWFSRATASPRWFLLWVLIFFAWIPARHVLIERKLMTSDEDIILITFLWSFMPFAVENALKAATALQMQVLTTILECVQQAVDVVRKTVDEVKGLIVDMRGELAQMRKHDEEIAILLRRLDERDRAQYELISKVLSALIAPEAKQ